LTSILQRERSSKKIWVDLDNTPHVPFFFPIIYRLEELGYQTVITTRNAFQVAELATAHKLSFQEIGRHAGRNRLKKILSLFSRTFALFRFAQREGPHIAISHGARSQIQAANILGIPTVEFIDYEHVATPPLCRPKWEIVPQHYDESKRRTPLNQTSIPTPQNSGKRLPMNSA